MSTPYRSPPSNETPERGESALVYTPKGRDDQSAGFGWAVRVLGPPALAGALAWQLSAIAALGVGASVVSGALSVWWARRKRVGGVVLRASAGRLRVFTRDPKRPAFDIALESLVEIALETKTIERVVEGGSANLGMAYLNPQLAPPTDTNRIVLETDETTFALTDEHYGHADTLEWFAKIRVFLRKAGWAPKSERGLGDDDDDDDDDDVDDDAVDDESGP